MYKNGKLRIKCPPSVEFPSSRFSAPIKQLCFDQIDEDTISLMDICFPQLSRNELSDEPYNDDKPALKISSDGMFFSDGQRRRRFSGCDLPGKRYFTICNTPTGNDRGTLCYELFSYWTSVSGVFVSLTDFTTHTAALDQAGIPAEDRGPILQVAVSNLIDISVDNSGNLSHGGEVYCFYLPIKIVDIDCDNVLDLRRTDAQKWLTTMLGRGESLTDFLEILPNLVSPNPGGDVFHYSLANLLRLHGCKGLVFPSARQNVYLKTSDDGIIEHSGWNFVLYHDSPLKSCSDPAMLMPLGFETNESVMAEIRYKEGQNGLRQWEINGVQDREWGRAYYEIRSAFGSVPRTGNYVHIFNEIRRKHCYEGNKFLERLSQKELQELKSALEGKRR